MMLRNAINVSKMESTGSKTSRSFFKDPKAFIFFGLAPALLTITVALVRDDFRQQLMDNWVKFGNSKVDDTKIRKED